MSEYLTPEHFVLRFRCNRCNQEFPETSVEVSCTFPGSTEEPPEYEFNCPYCGSNNLEEEDFLECPYCKEIGLPSFGGECLECSAITHF